MHARLAAAIAALAILFASLGSVAVARTIHHDVNRVFSDVTIQPDDIVEGNVNVAFGHAHIMGRVMGNVNVLGGSCDTMGAHIEGEENCVESASLSTVAPWVGSFIGPLPLAEQTNRLFLMLAANLVVLLVFLIFPMRVRLALARVETHPALSALIGTIAFVAIVPVAILLLLSIIGIPLIVLEIATLFVGIWIGQGAIALLVGRRLTELIRPNTTPSPLAALLLGLVVVSAAEIVPLVGWAVTALTSLVGLGAAVLGFVREPQRAAIRPAIGGPPMTRTL